MISEMTSPVFLVDGPKGSVLKSARTANTKQKNSAHAPTQSEPKQWRRMFKRFIRDWVPKTNVSRLG